MCLGIPGLIEAINEETNTKESFNEKAINEGSITITKETLNLNRTGQVRFGGAVKEINLSFLPECKVGDYVIVHVGVAISKIDEEEAKIIFSYLKEIDELEGLPVSLPATN